MLNKAFAYVLRDLRNKKCLSQEKFAFEAGLHRTYVSQLERGLKTPSLNTLQRIAKVLGISLSSMFGLIEQRGRK